MQTKTLNRSKNISLVALVTVAILSIQLIAMQFTNEVKWGILDFATMGTLIFFTGMILLWLQSKVQTTTKRVVVTLVIVLAFLYVWAELAVGIFTN